MTQTETLKLINGSFTPAEAKEILGDIFQKKINFHNIRNWSSVERFGKPDLYSRQRVTELRADWKQIESICKEAVLQNRNVNVFSSIEIKIEES